MAAAGGSNRFAITQYPEVGLPTPAGADEVLALGFDLHDLQALGKCDLWGQDI